jgi:toxin FitB
MGTNFLIDTNILIYYFDGQIPINTAANVDEIFCESFNISIITRIEFLGWHKYDEKQYQNAVLFAEGANVVSLTEEIANKAVELRRKKQIKLPDAVIAATCLINHFTLVTRNQNDFKNIDGLELFNPFSF